ncbi:MAG TPA: hypothetical protein EYN66_12570 [Myxococcales bacterium]|nr:hypothetical protein [Myxococcales bacterium]
MLVAFRHFPLNFHANAEPAAKAAIAAQNQGKFWEYHDKIFESQDDLSTTRFEAIAKELGLNLETFKKDMKAQETEFQIKGDMVIASKAGIEGTPAFLVNGRKIVGALPFETFKTIIDTEISKINSLLKDGKSIPQARGEMSLFNMKKSLDPNSGGIETLARIDIEGAPGKGAADPLVAIIEFSDFQ